MFPKGTDPDGGESIRNYSLTQMELTRFLHTPSDVDKYLEQKYGLEAAIANQIPFEDSETLIEAFQNRINTLEKEFRLKKQNGKAMADFAIGHQI